MILKQRLSQRINDAKLLYSVLAAYKNYIEKVISSMADALLITTKLGEIKKVNTAALELFGYSEEELINQPIDLIFEQNKIWEPAFQQVSLYKKSFQKREIVCCKKTKEKILIAFSCLVIKKKIDGLEDIVYIGRDITARQRRQQRNNAQYAITRILSKSQSVKQAIPKIIQAICENLAWDLGELWTSNQYIEASVQRCSVNPVLRCVEIWSSRTLAAQEFKAITWQTTYTPSVGLPGQIWVTRSPVWMSHISHHTNHTNIERLGKEQGADGRCFNEAASERRSQAAVEAGLHTAFGFPILADNEMLGVMIFLSRDVQSKDADLLQMMVSIGSQIAQFIKRKQAESALLESEERYRDLFENANDLIQSVTPYGRLEYVNRAWLKTLGYTQAEIHKINLFDIIHPDFQEESRELFCRVMSGEKLEQLTTVFVSKDGQKIFVEGNINCKFVEGKPVATRGIFRNITDSIVAEEALRHQQQETERVLLDILPEAIFNRQKEEAGTIAEDFANVTVLFADIVGLTEIASQITAVQLVNILNKIFSVFDQLTERYGLEKIKTTGDAYMVVGGLPRGYPNHAQAIALEDTGTFAIAQMALDMQTAIAQFNTENNKNFSIRIGIHSGPVAAEAISMKKFTYDLWGDTVKIASCMQSQGLAGKIQVTEITYKCLRDEFLFEKRGEIEIKGKGKMTTYVLVSRK
ncbi:adenylate/guanylate cyclase domain-containing protein [Scytonema sp. HK-05]|uniref:adenylate/guanylate cyclase domain-containing protein n=1 Tax=Scytonema sp. HK-05 TaxID=1137095 RepID=UPI001E3B1752|nr:adenylate/guanylate cyclase domain-containing protein [Scytonema sp. HK-05]